MIPAVALITGILGPGALAVARERFDEITDWIGIPLGVLAVAVFVVLDLRRESDRSVSVLQALAMGLVVVAASAVILVRFAVLSG